ncbi:hypothetical protein [Candidatus Bodocaedibacter vickermanii]|uniref:Uncharacterized protein n=1 Tax=Candidatus Bodocaedibacter vickermanii TaxID=2741701 RepID=A0A7L9RTM8_9PROT|nr:hypothetical protein CPBP_00744 [Candidatus Paracaedibacteraceae bacterium 'Lake Konstanz']
MVFESILLIFLIATLVLGIRLYFGLQRLKTYKDDYSRFLNKTEAQLSDIEKITERFRYISNAEKESFERLINKAKSLKDDLLYISERSENIFQKLSSTSKAIKVDTLLTDQKKETKQSEKTSQLTSKKNKLINTIKDLR